ncbi:hypothetical protein ACFWA9_08415 [Kitasatospora sp. NPDC059973]|uniref:hypothetical protein n=1 Tax=Kitasatospora sp. NPDC059973 TaxID=3347020 RepID=UPI00367958EF
MAGISWRTWTWTRRALIGLCGAVLLLPAALVVIRRGDWDDGTPPVLLPYAAGAGLVVLGVLLALRPWWAAALAGPLATGLTETHAELGRGGSPAWPEDNADFPHLPPVIQIGHVLHGEGLTAVAVSGHRVPGTDHRAVVAELAVTG